MALEIVALTGEVASVVSSLTTFTSPTASFAKAYHMSRLTSCELEHHLI